MKVILALLLPALLAGALALSTMSVLGDDPPKPRLQPGDVLWGDRYFRSPDTLADWLQTRGASYRAWAKRHPKAAARQENAAQP